MVSSLLVSGLEGTGAWGVEGLGSWGVSGCFELQGFRVQSFARDSIAPS